MISLCSLLLFIFMVYFAGVLFLAFKMYNLKNVLELLQSKSQADNLIFIVLLISLLFFVIGLAGYQANYIHLRLDQLFEAPNHHLGLFIHYTSWSFHLGAIPLAVFPVVWCNHPRPVAHIVLDSVPIIVTVMLIILVAIIRLKKYWFFTETVQENPYKLVYKVIPFARKHKHPLQRSAFTFADNYMPSRLDFAKERYGGTFHYRTSGKCEDIPKDISHFAFVGSSVYVRGTCFILHISLNLPAHTSPFQPHGRRVL